MFPKLFDLDTSDVGRSNRAYSDDETLVIQSVLRDAEHLLREPRRLHELISQCKVALAPHRKLPEDVLRCIFALHVQGGMHIPFKRSDIPAAVVLTHVCSLWRRIALSSPELWTNISLEMDNCNCSFLPCALELLSRTRDLPIHLELRVSFYYHGSDHRDFDFSDAVYQLTSNRNLQKLRLYIDASSPLEFFPKFFPRDTFSVGTFNRVQDLDLHLYDNAAYPVLSQSSFPNVEAFSYQTTITGGDLNLPGMPWNQLRQLDLSKYIQDVPTAVGLLSQCMLIEECKLFVVISGYSINPKVTLPNLRALEFVFMQIEEEDFDILDAFFSLLSFPTLQSLVIFEEDSITFSSRVASPLTRNLKLMAPQLHKVRFNIPIDNGEACTLLERMPSLQICDAKL